MPSFQYGSTTIEWLFKQDSKLKSHYVTVERNKPVLLRGPKAGVKAQTDLIRYRARWIKKKLFEVNQATKEEVVTGSRATYRGRSYYCELEHKPEAGGDTIRFNQSKLIVITKQKRAIPLDQFKVALEFFYYQKAQQKLGARVAHWQRETGLEALMWKIKPMKSRWAHCNENNVLEFHPRCMMFSARVMDYIIVHELCHTVEKFHNNDFWRLVARHCPEWEKYHAEVEQVGEMGL